MMHDMVREAQGEAQGEADCEAQGEAEREAQGEAEREADREALAHTAFGETPAVFAAIRLPHINLAVWQRRLPAEVAAEVAALVRDGAFARLGQLRLVLAVDAVAPALRQSLAQGADGAARFEPLIADIAALADGFAKVMGLARIELRLEHVIGDACRRFHADYVAARLLTTYAGPGTQWLAADAARRFAAAAPPAAHEIRALATGDVALLKGRVWTEAPIVHRSPPIAGSGAARLLLVLNPPLAD